MEGRVVTGDYLTCGDQDDSIELFGMNVYSWCGNSSYYTSGYDELYEQFQSFNIPMVFAETGCKTNDNDRDFSEVETMLGPVFQALFSGSIVYEWAMDQSGYGIVKYSNDDHTGFPSTLDEYNALATVFSSVEPAGTTVTDYTPSNSPRACPTSDSSLWELDPDKALPTINGLDVDTVTARTTIISTTQTGSGERGAATNTEGGSPPDEGTDHSSTLSKGAVAGVAVGCVIAVLVIGLIATLLFIRRRNAKNQKMSEKAQPGSQEDSPQGDSSGVGGHEQLFKAELPAASVGRIMPRQEMDASQLPQGLQDYYGPGKDKDGSVANGTNESDTTAQGRSQTYEMEGSTPPMSELPGRSH